MNYSWKLKAKEILKHELSQREINAVDLVKLLKAIDVIETKNSIDSKLSRGTFSAVFFIQCMKALGIKNIPLDEYIGNQNEFKETANGGNQLFFSSKDGIRYLNATDFIKSPNNDEPTVISLFSGAGGFDIGLEQAGFKTLACIEIDKSCRLTLEHNRPEWKVFDKDIKIEKDQTSKRVPGDIRDISPQEILDFVNAEKGKVSLVVGGAPCQPFSNMGKREGRNNEKNGDLFLEFVKMIKGIEPKSFIFENVAGITQSKHSSVIKYMIDNLSGLGYNLSFTTLNSADYGVPQRRKRFFLVGIQGDTLPAFPLPTHSSDTDSWDRFVTSLDKVPDFKPKPWVTVRDAFGKLKKDYKKRPDYAVMNCTAKVVHRMTFIKPGKNFKVLPMELRPECWKNGKHQGQDTFGRMVPDLPSVTIRTAGYNPAKGMYIHPFENRGLNTIEMAILQDFPYSWGFKCEKRDGMTLKSGGMQIGNAVPPGMAKALGQCIRIQLDWVPNEESERTSAQLVEAY